ncbi:MAG: HisA/HisF-related TIM barrel protein [Eggerthellaceae bacterium]
MDLIAGKVVRLERAIAGMRRCIDDPAAVARSFLVGARWVRVVDLSAAFEEGRRARGEQEGRRRPVPSKDFGRRRQGVRSLDRIDELAEAGASRIALGTAVVRDPSFAEAAAVRYGELLVADVAARDGMVKVNGWREGAGVSADDLVARLADFGFRHLVFTDIARDGMQTGIDDQAYRHIANVAGFPVVASGGIASLRDIEKLARLEDGVVEGCITGRALYEGSFTLSQALAAARG